MVEEVRRLLAEGIQPDDLIYYGLEYKYLTLYAIGKMTYDEMFTGLETAIHQVCQTANDLVSGNGTKRFHHSLGRWLHSQWRKRLTL